VLVQLLLPNGHRLRRRLADAACTMVDVIIRNARVVARTYIIYYTGMDIDVLIGGHTSWYSTPHAVRPSVHLSSAAATGRTAELDRSTLNCRQENLASSPTMIDSCTDHVTDHPPCGGSDFIGISSNYDMARLVGCHQLTSDSGTRVRIAEIV